MNLYESDLYIYRCKVIKYIDGDSFHAVIDFGDDKREKQILRCQHLDTWEKRGEQKSLGLAATVRAMELIPLGKWFRIRTYKDRSGKYGRLLFTLQFEDGTWYHDIMLAEGHDKKRRPDGTERTEEEIVGLIAAAQNEA
jgi:endonuclease YncB( thermonuclease family)